MHPPVPHLPGSRTYPGDATVSLAVAGAMLHKTRAELEMVVVQEFLDGDAVAVLRHGRDLVPIARDGSRALNSGRRALRWFHEWALGGDRPARFLKLLEDGERAVGVWLAQARGTRYRLPHEPFVVVDLLTSQTSTTAGRVMVRAHPHGFATPRILHAGPALGIETAAAAIDQDRSMHGAIDPVPGLFYRLEENLKVTALAQWVRPDWNPTYASQPGGVWNAHTLPREAGRN